MRVSSERVPADGNGPPGHRAPSLLRLIDEEGWRSAAACRSADPELFFPISGSGKSLAQIAEAKAVCAGCWVRRECLSFAQRTRQRYGVWGGLTEQERYPAAMAACTSG